MTIHIPEILGKDTFARPEHATTQTTTFNLGLSLQDEPDSGSFVLVILTPGEIDSTGNTTVLTMSADREPGEPPQPQDWVPHMAMRESDGPIQGICVGQNMARGVTIATGMEAGGLLWISLQVPMGGKTVFVPPQASFVDCDVIVRDMTKWAKQVWGPAWEPTCDNPDEFVGPHIHFIDPHCTCEDHD